MSMGREIYRRSLCADNKGCTWANGFGAGFPVEIANYFQV